MVLGSTVQTSVPSNLGIPLSAWRASSPRGTARCGGSRPRADRPSRCSSHHVQRGPRTSLRASLVANVCGKTSSLVFRPLKSRASASSSPLVAGPFPHPFLPASVGANARVGLGAGALLIQVEALRDWSAGVSRAERVEAHLLEGGELGMGVSLWSCPIPRVAPRGPGASRRSARSLERVGDAGARHGAPPPRKIPSRKPGLHAIPIPVAPAMATARPIA